MPSPVIGEGSFCQEGSMSQKEDYYKILGVEKSSSEGDIKKAYRKMAMQYHPDRNPGDASAEQKFKEVQEAYDVLGNSQKKAAYDQFGHAAFQGGAGGFSSQSFDMGDIFEGIFGDSPFGDIFGFLGGGRRSNRPRRGADIQYQMDLSFKEAVFGSKTEISVPRTEECKDCTGKGHQNEADVESCPVCKGRGQIQRTQGFLSVSTTCHQCNGRGQVIKNPCQTCSGRGFKKKSSKLSVSIPAGVDDGFRIKLKREGEAGLNGGPPGDLYLLIKVEDHEFFEREGNHIILNQKLTFAQAALGCEVKVPTLTGTVKLRVPEGTQSGQVFRIKSEGVKDVHSGSKGDQLIHVVVETPKNLNARQKELLKEFAESRGEKHEEADFLDRMTEKVKDIFGS